MKTPLIEAVRLGLRGAAPLLYRIDVRGAHLVPATGPALLIANHVTYADSLVLAGLLDRPIRFLVYHRLHDQPGLNWFFRTVRAIPVAPRREDPILLEAAMEAAADTLRSGELLGLFPEGQLTRDGEIGRFQRGLETILAAAPAPVVPVSQRGLWGSALSHAGGAPFSRLPAPGRRRVQVDFGAPLAPDGLTAAHLQRVVRRMRGPVP